MATVERVLLYVVAIGFGVTLLVQSRQPGEHYEPTAPTDPNSIRIAARPDLAAVSSAQGILPASAESAEEQSAAAGPARLPAGSVLQDESKLELTRRSLIIVDDAGQPKIELSVDADGEPRIALNDKTGHRAISLTAGRTSEVVVQKGPGRAVLQTEWNGTASVELTTQEGPQARMFVSPRGETEIAVTSRSGKSEAMVRIDRRGAAEVAIRGEDGKSGPAMTLFPSGDCGIALNGPDGEPGPVMKLFRDQLAEIAIHESETKSGPSILRTPDGVSAISLRRANGHPAASIVSSPDGSAVLTVTSQNGKQQAGLRIGADGNADVIMTDPKPGQPEPEQQVEPVEPSEESVL